MGEADSHQESRTPHLIRHPPGQEIAGKDHCGPLDFLHARRADPIPPRTMAGGNPGDCVVGTGVDGVVGVVAVVGTVVRRVGVVRVVTGVSVGTGVSSGSVIIPISGGGGQPVSSL